LKAFVADIAVKTGKGRSTIARDVTRAKKVAVLDDIAGTCLDKGDEGESTCAAFSARKALSRTRSSARATPKPVRLPACQPPRGSGHEKLTFPEWAQGMVESVEGNHKDVSRETSPPPAT
jgi:hypothetical protein